MFRPVLVVALLTGMACAEVPPQRGAANARVIPLNEIWAYKMPGTRNVRELERPLADRVSSREFLEQSQSIKFQRLLMKRLEKDEVAPRAFFVRGTKLQALQNAVSEFEARTNPQYKVPAKITVPANVELSLVFFSYACGRYVHLDRVVRNENRFLIDYRYVGHISTDTTSHFAIIPVGRLEPGPGKVLVERLPPVHQDGERITVLNDGHKRVCQSFNFEVQDDEVPNTAVSVSASPTLN